MEPAEYELMARIEQRYWWYVGRRFLATRLIERWIGPGPLSLLDAGCGTGGNLLALRRFGTVAGCDFAAEAVRFCHERGLAEVVQQTHPSRLPFPDERFDLVTLFDVIEHVRDDVAMLRELRRVLRPGGAVFLTTPAHPALWSVHDESVHHVRRYTRRELRDKLCEAGLRPARTTYLNAVLLPLIVPVRWLRDRLGRPRPATSDFHLDLPAWLDAAFAAAFRAEWAWLRFAPLPIGLSLCALARREG